MGFQYSMENVVNHLTINGMTAIPGEIRSIEELEGMSWNLKPPEQTSVRVPSRVAVNERLNRSVSLRFERYRQTPQPPRYSVDQRDREVIGNDNLDEDEEHFVGICSQTPQIKHTPYDVCFCEDCLNEARILEDKPLNKEPSGKWDYYVRYDAPINITPIEEVTATGWGEEFSDEEVTPGKVTILNEAEEESDWDDDKRSGGKTLVIQEKLAQSQQDFLDEYLPQWDDQLATRKQRSELECENPFAANREHAFPTAADDAESSTSYQPLPDAIMGPAVYPPARQNHNRHIDQTTSLVILKEKAILFIKDMQWRTAYPGAYSTLETISDDPQNITSQVRQLIILEDLYRGSTDEHDRAYRDLDRITCEETNNLWLFLEDFRQLAIKSRKLYFPSTTEKLFAKLPPSLSKKIEELFKTRHLGLSAGVLPAIKFIHTFVSKMCKDAALAKELRDLSLYSAILIPGINGFDLSLPETV
nr:hypothetical protein MA16_Dca006990 [Tanacetum cinerariifolium]